MCGRFYAQGKTLELRLFSDPALLLSLLLVAILVGLGAGMYPALYLSKFLPGEILKSTKSVESKNSTKMRSLLVIFQFSISMILVISTLVAYDQTVFSNNIDVGYQNDNKLVLNVRSARENLASLKQELLSLPEISSVVYSSQSPTQDDENNNYFKLLETLSDGVVNEQVLLNYNNMGFGFFEAYKVTPIAGRLFDEDYGSDEISLVPENSTEPGKGSVILNETGLKELGFTSAEQAVGKTLAHEVRGKQHLTIIGVIPDIYFRSVKFDVRPTAYTLNPTRLRAASLTFSTDNVSALLNKIEVIWKRNVLMQPIELEFLSEMMKAQYNDEMTTAQLFLVFSLLAVVIACLGLSAFTVELRTKEIGIRKVMGASVKDIVSLLIWQFSKPVAIANVVAWPIAAYLMLSWLESFPYCINELWVSPICLGVGLLSLLIVWSTVGGNAAKVARKNPVKALRYR